MKKLKTAILFFSIIILSSIVVSQQSSNQDIWLENGENSVTIEPGDDLRINVRGELYIDRNREEGTWHLHLEEQTTGSSSTLNLTVDTIQASDDAERVSFIAWDVNPSEANHWGAEPPRSGTFRLVNLKKGEAEITPDFSENEVLTVNIQDSLEIDSEERAEWINRMVITGRTDELDRDFSNEELKALAGIQTHIGEFSRHVNYNLDESANVNVDDKVADGLTVKQVIKLLREHAREEHDWNKGAKEAYSTTIGNENNDDGLAGYTGEGDFYQSENGYILSSNTVSLSCYNDLGYKPPEYPDFIPEYPDANEQLANTQVSSCPDSLESQLSWTEDYLYKPSSYCYESGTVECYRNVVEPECPENPEKGSICYRLKENYLDTQEPPENRVRTVADNYEGFHWKRELPNSPVAGETYDLEITVYPVEGSEELRGDTISFSYREKGSEWNNTQTESCKSQRICRTSIEFTPKNTSTYEFKAVAEYDEELTRTWEVNVGSRSGSEESFQDGRFTWTTSTPTKPLIGETYKLEYEVEDSGNSLDNSAEMTAKYRFSDEKEWTETSQSCGEFIRSCSISQEFIPEKYGMYILNVSLKSGDGNWSSFQNFKYTSLKNPKTGWHISDKGYVRIPSSQVTKDEKMEIEYPRVQNPSNNFKAVLEKPSGQTEKLEIEDGETSYTAGNESIRGDYKIHFIPTDKMELPGIGVEVPSPSSSIEDSIDQLEFYLAGNWYVIDECGDQSFESCFSFIGEETDFSALSEDRKKLVRSGCEYVRAKGGSIEDLQACQELGDI